MFFELTTIKGMSVVVVLVSTRRPTAEGRLSSS